MNGINASAVWRVCFKLFEQDRTERAFGPACKSLSFAEPTRWASSLEEEGKISGVLAPRERVCLGVYGSGKEDWTLAISCSERSLHSLFKFFS